MYHMVWPKTMPSVQECRTIIDFGRKYQFSLILAVCEYTGFGFVEISEIFAMLDAIRFWKETTWLSLGTGLGW